ncbi:ATP synthase F1 subunit gamma [bacterium]|nr:ATP synthase F1 subunit gamma [bacterium]
MANLREVKQRIVSVKKTKKITSAMKMVAASKFRRAQERVTKAKLYGDALGNMINDLSARLSPNNLPSLLEPGRGTKEAIILITGDRGLCGGFNSNIIKKAKRVIADKKDTDIDLILIGNKGNQQLKNENATIRDSIIGLAGDLITESAIEKIVAPLVTDYINGAYGKITLIYSEFVSVLTTQEVEKQLLPFELKDWPSETVTDADFIYEPSKEAVLEAVITKLIFQIVLQAQLESKAAEEGARMTAMDSATDNASEMIKDLTLLFNRSRQAAITTELTEIVAGAASLN